jgi:hypothetical protein
VFPRLPQQALLRRRHQEKRFICLQRVLQVQVHRLERQRVFRVFLLMEKPVQQLLFLELVLLNWHRRQGYPGRV